MKLVTNIKPRTDGTVIARDASGVPHVFKADETGALVCDIADKAFISRLLSQNDGGDFEPADPADFDEAEKLIPRQDAGDGDEGDDEGDLELGEDDEAPAGGLPLEANTPAAPDKSKAKGAKAARA